MKKISSEELKASMAGFPFANGVRFLRGVQLWTYLPATLAALCSYQCVAAPGILITNLPSYQSTDNLAGLVLGVDPSACRVAVFTYSSAAGWNTKPYCSTPLTLIQPDGSWVTDITTGGSDTNATRVAALLVSTNFSYPCVQGASYLPTNLLSQALAQAIVTRPSPGQRWISFSGYDWLVRTTTGGPGPNFFSDSTSNLWVDALGRLHLRITHRSYQWQCAELYSARSFGYGSYRFRLDSRVDNLNESVVLGLFTYSSDPSYNDREIDVECSRWGIPSNPNNAQFVVQPATAGHRVRFAVPVGLTNSSYVFTWQTNQVIFQSLRGAYSTSPDPTNIIANWTFASSGVPQAGDEVVDMNLWLFQGNAPTDSKEVEVIVQSFEFVPLGTPPTVSLKADLSPQDGLFRFQMNTQPDFRYQVQATTNFAVWQDLDTLLATNIFVECVDTNSIGSALRFFRTVTLP